MKTNYIRALAGAGILLAPLIGRSQASSVSHAGVAGDWCGWNAATAIPFRLEHQGTQDINFFTGPIQRATIKGTAAGATTGFVGIGNAFTAPQFKLHLFGNAGILSTGNTLGAGPLLPAALSGPRFIWYPSKAAFRAGDASGAIWDDASTGVYSAAFGQDNTARGDHSFSAGQRNSSIGAMSVTFGNVNVANGSRSLAGGGSNQTLGDLAFTWGANNKVGVNSVGMGQRLDASNFSFAFGNSIINTANLSFSSGDEIKNDGTHAFAYGTFLNIPNTSNNSFVFGNGVSVATPLVNTIAKSYMVGFDSDIPTMTVRAPLAAGTGATGFVGVATSNPGNKLEVNSTVANASGLRFTQLTSASPIVANPGAGVLAVDANGDVIYVNAGGSGAGPGAYCPAPASPLTNNYRIPFNNFNIYYPGQSASTNAMGLGYDCVDPLPAKLSVLQHNVPTVGVSTTAGSFINRDQAGAPSTTYKAINAVCDRQQVGNNITNIGGDFTAEGSPSNNFGVRASAAPTSLGAGNSTAGSFRATTLSNGANIGLSSIAGNSNAQNYGIYTQASGGVAGSFNYGIYAVNPGVSANDWAGWFQGNLNVNGLAYCTLGAWSSDRRFKRDVRPLGDVFEKLGKVNGYDYEYKTEEFRDMNFTKGRHIGFIAQELKEVFPELVVEGPGGYQYVNYIGMIPVLLEAVKNQQQQISELRAAQSAAPASNVMTTELSDAASIVLDQNVPNPFAEQTSIAYTLTDGVQKAQMLFYNSEGRLINSVDLKTSPGKNQLNVFANDLSNGLYSYTLVVDGKIMDSKRMVKTK